MIAKVDGVSAFEQAIARANADAVLRHAAVEQYIECYLLATGASIEDLVLVLKDGGKWWLEPKPRCGQFEDGGGI